VNGHTYEMDCGGSACTCKTDGTGNTGIAVSDGASACADIQKLWYDCDFH
jgi:hypothetical protein